MKCTRPNCTGVIDTKTFRCPACLENWARDVVTTRGGKCLVRFMKKGGE